ncbi:MAG: DUF1003 domain-containing protein [Desulfosporosinus sp.]|nr:DUF1003 domain-containing protein [Desulfosporosinus sp.]
MQNSKNKDEPEVTPNSSMEISDTHAQRIDRLVDEYKSHILTQLNAQEYRETTRSDRLADKVAFFAGSWKFIIIFSSFLILWMLWNSLTLTKLLHFDVAPFILLNLILSFTAAFQAPFIIMSQNRQAIRDKHEAIVDFSINYKAEIEIDDIQKHLHHLELQVADIHQMLHKLHSKQTEQQINQ